MKTLFTKPLVIKQLYIFFCLFLVGNNTLATTLDVAVGWSKPPYVIAENNSGFELELVTQVMDSLGYKLNPVYVPFGRTQSMLESGEVDLMLTANHTLGINPDQLSDVYVVYKNVAISLKKNDIHISKIEELGDYSVVAFQNASMILGEKYNQVMSKNLMYLELPDQKNQVEMLFQKNVEVIVIDINIFNYLSKQLIGSKQLDNVNIHPLFPESKYQVGFVDSTLKFEFDKALASFLSSKSYKQLNDKYDLYPLEASANY